MRMAFANEVAENSLSLRKFLANGRLRQNSLAIADAMAWCTQPPTRGAAVGNSRSHKMQKARSTPILVCLQVSLLAERERGGIDREKARERERERDRRERERDRNSVAGNSFLENC